MYQLRFGTAIGRPVVWLALLLIQLGLSVSYAQEEGHIRAVSRSTGDLSGMSLQEADEFIRKTFGGEREQNYDSAAKLYLRILEDAGPILAEEDRQTIARHLRHLELVLPHSIALEVCEGTDEDVALSTCRLAPDAGEKLVTWWRSQNPLPATFRNERVEEHLQRVAFSERSYATDRREIGFDDRGVTYVRYGEPDRKTEVDVTNDVWLTQRLRTASSVSPSDFPKAEFWIYRRIDHSAHFLFVEHLGAYRFGEANDLVPRRLQGRHAMIFLDAMRIALRQMALYHIDYSNRFNEVDDYMLDGYVPGGNLTSPQSMSMSITGRNNVEDAAIRARQTNLPQQSSDVLRRYSPLLVNARAVRFLDEEGNTTIDLFWSHPPESFDLSRRERRFFQRSFADEALEGYAVNLTASISSDDYLRNYASTQVYRVGVQDAHSGYPTAVQAITLTTRFPQFHVQAQWDGYAIVNKDGSGPKLGPQMKQITFRQDSLDQLNSAEDVLEVSDIKPLFRPEDESVDSTTPYPFSAITPTVELSLYFEVYHLQVADDELAHYTVSYEIVKQEDPRGFLRLSRPGAESVVASYTVSTASSHADEFIELDLSPWRGTGQLEVVVTVKDETTGQEVKRSIEFELMEGMNM